ncbi:hypothetical protein M2451_002560 [Dysgonomonas sp. PFB1-18]|uniref:hypothetical protein n=1 Tax=unclassified Dysgonomonas TaxID=2630389 RepID=UPI0024771CA7|nr:MULTISPECIES: hypothetical protein [unclassified Dysgonomonas]MDH6308041.1 hypothetical protein [Dysgonomonas sp. PF1-14]MDH6339580.1 hypothetical protein [Dysgonomonas sp. PF1-16]MDH6381231.1 hypothetical protein [Dysgonomonas sp. PFB1-18]MDH6398443.1 hypothetical protein [Dysgonomonas sp. PF1-23]
MIDEEKKELTKEERLEIEEQAIQALLQMGAKFSVPLKIEPRKAPKRVLMWNKLFPGKAINWRDKRIPKKWDVETISIPDVDFGAIKETIVRNFHIKPLYLGTIDTLRKLYLEIEYNEEAIQEQPLAESKELFKYIPVMAEIAAIAIINNGEIANPLSKETKELKEFFIKHLTVGRLQKLAGVINQMMNPGGFTTSIRLIREVGATKPRADRIELQD